MSSSAFIAADGVLLTGVSAYLIARAIPSDLVEVLQADGYQEAWIEEAVNAIDHLQRSSAAWVRSRRMTAERRGATELRSGQRKCSEAVTSSNEMTATVSTSVAADHLEVSARRVLQLVQDGTLPAQREGRSWRIDSTAVIDQVARRRAQNREEHE